MKRVPLFEVFITFISYSFALALWTNDTLFGSNVNGYSKVASLASESTYAAVFTVAATIKVIALLADIKSLRIIGLISSLLIYLTFSILFFMDQSTFLPLVMGILSLTCGMCIITDVKHTKL